jgi:competence protein ComEA
MLKQASVFISGLLAGLLAAGLMLLVIRPRPRHPIKLLPPPTAAPLQIHVAGAVENPGVVTIPAGSIIAEAIEAAGGATQDADLSRLNLAQQLSNGQQVFVPIPVRAASSPRAGQVEVESANKININTATEVQLELLPGIGPSLAVNIVEYRQQHGWFQEAEELLQVSGIGPAKLEQIAEMITFH